VGRRKKSSRSFGIIAALGKPVKNSKWRSFLQVVKENFRGKIRIYFLKAPGDTVLSGL